MVVGKRRGVAAEGGDILLEVLINNFNYVTQYFMFISYSYVSIVSIS